MQVENGRLTSFWQGAWCGSIPLRDSFPEIFHICNEREITVADAAAHGWNFSFRRYLSPELAAQIHGLLGIVRQTNLSQEKDKPVWKWTKSGIYSVKSMYNHLCRHGADRSFKHLWKSKIPLKIKIWLWLIWHDAIATKDNLLKRNWNGSASCQFCHHDESISHLFLSVLQQNMYGVQLLWLLVQMSGLGVSHSSLSGSHVLFLPAGMFRLLVLQRFAGQSGNCVTELVLT
jgi:hypothetical protein